MKPLSFGSWWKETLLLWLVGSSLWDLSAGFELWWRPSFPIGRNPVWFHERGHNGIFDACSRKTRHTLPRWKAQLHGASSSVEEDEIAPNEESVSKTLNQQEITENPPPGGPFVRSYPRYRVDLSRVPRRPETASSSSFSSFFSGLGNRLPFGRVASEMAKQQYASQFPLAEIQVVDLASTKEKETLPFAAACHAMTSLWQAAQQVQEGGEHETNGRLVILADPTLAGVARNFVDLLDWANEQCATQDSQGKRNNKKSFPVQAQFFASPNDRLGEIPDAQGGKRQSPDQSSSVAPAAVLLSSPVPSSTTPPTTTPYGPFVRNATTETMINDHTRSWVQRLLVERGICPFTKNVEWSGQGLKKEGVPVGRIAYHAVVVDDEDDDDSSKEQAPDEAIWNLVTPLMARTWETMYEMLLAGPEGKEGGISSILLAAPAFDQEFEFWSGPLFALLEASVVAAQAEPWLGVVCFHPQYAVSDGSSWPGFGHMHSLPRLQEWVHNAQVQDESKSCPARRPKRRRKQGTNAAAATPVATQGCCPEYSVEEIAAGGAWQRRTPHATINVLRANQLAAAEQVRSSETLYPRNIQVLRDQIGFDQLWHDLQREQKRSPTDQEPQ